MGDMRIRAHGVLAAAFLALPLLAQPTPPTPRIDIIGASVSAGYVDPRANGDLERNDTVPLLRVLRHIWPGEAATVASRANAALFRDAPTLGERQVRLTERSHPDLVVAVDFLFWFGYGSAGRGERGREARLRLQTEGLELLERLQCPVILGDYPDMSGADARILHPAMVPDRETLDELNRRLRAWAEARPNVHVFPLARWVQQVKEEGYPIPLKEGPLQSPPLFLLQSDKLHATRLGMALLGYQVQAFAKSAFPEDHPLVKNPVSLDAIIEAIGAAPDLEELRKAPAGAGGRRG